MAVNLRSRLSHWVGDYCVKPAATAGFFVLVALLWTFPLQHLTAYPFIFLFLGAIIGSAWFGGVIAGAFAIVASYVVIAFLFIPPLYSMTIGEPFRPYDAAYLACGTVCIVVSGIRKHSERVIRGAKDDLEATVEERTAELRRSNRELLERERQLKLLTESIHQQIWSADANGRIEYCNRDLLDYAGKRLDELEGEAFFDIFYPPDASTFRDNWEAARSSIAPFELQARVRAANGGHRLFLIRGIPQRNSEGEIARWYGVHIDIEDKQRAQQRRQRAQEDLSRSNRNITLAEMAATIAHQLNQPLAALSTDASACQHWIKSEPPNLERANAAAERIVRDSARASAVVGRVRSLFSQNDYIRQPTDINLLIVEFVSLLTDDARHREVSIDLQLQQNLPRVSIDPVQIQQVLLNLAMNGMDAMQEADGPRILRIKSFSRGHGEVAVAVSDCGNGVPTRVQERLFEPFFTTKVNGTGMGLAICRSIIEAHDGRIAGSTSESGAVFEFALKTNG